MRIHVFMYGCSLSYLKPNSTVHCKRKDYVCSVLYGTCTYFRVITSVLVPNYITKSFY